MTEVHSLKKKFRWKFNLIEGDKHHEPFFINLGYQPFEDVELELAFLNQKPTLDLYNYSEEDKKRLTTQIVSFTLFYDDGEYHANIPKEPTATLYRWISEFYKDKHKELWNNWGGVLTLCDGCENTFEKWMMPRIRTLAINFGDLDYSSTIKVSLLYDVVDYKSPKMCDTLNLLQWEKERSKPNH